MYIKDFENWNFVKQRIDKEERDINIRAGEIRWIMFGVNVGSEIDGKGSSFTRPGLIISISGSNIALVVPMSTKIKDVAGYISFEWKGEITSLCIHQIRVISQKRILRRMGRISENKLQLFKEEIKKFFNL